MISERAPDAAAGRWAELLGGWGLPQAILDQAPESPWGHEPRRFAVDETPDRDTTSARWAREVLPPDGRGVGRRLSGHAVASTRTGSTRGPRICP